MIVISFDAECVNQNTAPDIAGLSRDPRYCVGITGEMSEEQREILEAQHVAVRVGDKTQMAPPLLLWSRLLPGDDKAATLKKIEQRVSAHRHWHINPDGPIKVDVRGWVHMGFVDLAEQLAKAEA